MPKPPQHALFSSLNHTPSPSTLLLYSRIPNSIPSTYTTYRSQTFHFENLNLFPFSRIQPPHLAPIHNNRNTASLKHFLLHFSCQPSSLPNIPQASQHLLPFSYSIPYFISLTNISTLKIHTQVFKKQLPFIQEVNSTEGRNCNTSTPSSASISKTD